MHNDDYIKLNRCVMRLDNLMNVINENVTSESSVQLFRPVMAELSILLSELIAIGKPADERPN